MRSIFRIFLPLVVLAAALGIVSARAQDTASPASSQFSATIQAKTPVIAGACKACPWGQLAKVTADALQFYGYKPIVCWVCWSFYGPREMADKTKPVLPEGATTGNAREYIEPPPDAVPDISITMESNLIDAWNGTGAYAADHKQRHNYRVVAVVRTPTYILAAASRKSGITSLSQIKDRKEPTWIVGGSDVIFKYYGIDVNDLKAKGGGIMPPEGIGPNNVTREKRASAEVFIGGAVLVNTPEQRSWYEASQLNDLVYLDLDEPLLEQLARGPGYAVRVNAPLALFRGVDRPIPSVVRPNTFIYVRDDTPDDFAYALAKALDEHRELFQEQITPWYYDTSFVASSQVIPMAEGAMRYYRERGYVK
jgi:hypothetical protein